MSACAHCGIEVIQIAGKRRRRYCGTACRVAAFRSQRPVRNAPSGDVTISPAQDQGHIVTGAESAVPTGSESEGRTSPSIPEGYGAASIKILSPEEAAGRFLFAKTEDLAKKYPHIAPDFIRRLLESVELSGCPLDLAVRRYLDGDTTVEVPPEFVTCHVEAVQARRWK